MATQQRKCKFEIYKDRAGQFRWRLISGNGQIIATPGESFTTRESTVNNIRAVCACCTHGDIVNAY
jgi:uncharacterized protein YegP (UPF0339 family)